MIFESKFFRGNSQPGATLCSHPGGVALLRSHLTATQGGYGGWLRDVYFHFLRYGYTGEIPMPGQNHEYLFVVVLFQVHVSRGLWDESFPGGLLCSVIMNSSESEGLTFFY